MDRECDHLWSVDRIETCKMGKMTVGIPVYKCRKCGKERE